MLQRFSVRLRYGKHFICRLLDTSFSKYSKGVIAELNWDIVVHKYDFRLNASVFFRESWLKVNL